MTLGVVHGGHGIMVPLPFFDTGMCKTRTAEVLHPCNVTQWWPLNSGDSVQLGHTYLTHPACQLHR